MKKATKIMEITIIGAMLMASFSGCGTETSAATTAAKDTETTAAESNEDKTIYMITGQTTEYISMLTKEAKASAKAAGCELKVYDAEADLYKETQLIQLAVNDQADGLIIIPTASDDISQILKEAGDMNVVILNRELSDTSKLDETHVYIGPDENYSGTYQGEMAAEYLNGEGSTEITALMLTGPETLKHAVTRTEGAKKALSDNGITADFISLECEEDATVAESNIADAYDGKDVDFDVIISENDSMACGAIKGFEDIGLDISGIPVIGIDAIADAIANIKDGSMYGTVYQDVSQADMAVKACLNLINGKTYDEGLDGNTDKDNPYVTYTGWEKVTAENVDSYTK